MLSRRLLLSSSLALCAIVGLGYAADNCRYGTARGDWELPSASGASDGFISGALYSNSSPTPTPVYAISGILTDIPSPCLSCIGGRIDASLDDGIGGPGVDYLVKGSYSGSWFTGAGSFTADIYLPSGVGPVGKIEGTFSDSPSSGQIGKFEGNWVICP